MNEFNFTFMVPIDDSFTTSLFTIVTISQLQQTYFHGPTEFAMTEFDCNAV